MDFNLILFKLCFLVVEEDGNEDAEKMKSHVPKMPHKLFFLRPELVTDFMT